ncbi:MAG: hypothetical protein U0401_29650 [Anaerolineae bacterium]
MLPEVIQLEKLRQEIEKIEVELGSLSDYLDRGRPTEAQQHSTRRQMEAYQNQSAELRVQLHERLTSLRVSQPQVIEEWIQWHREACQRILAKPIKQVDDRVRRNLAGELLQSWDKVGRGEQEFVTVNPYYLSDYRQETARLVNSTGRWWNFWQR